MVACFFMTESHTQNKGNSLNLASQLTMSKTIRRTIDPKVLKGHPPLNKSPRAITEPRMDTNGWEETTKHTKYTKEKLRTTNGHEWARMGGRKPRNTRKARKENSEPRKDTKGHEREIQNHEWTRIGGWEPRNTRNTRKDNSEPRMDTNGHE